MTAVSIQCKAIESASPGCGSILLLLDMTAEQRLEAIRALLGEIPEQEAFDFMRSECPHWFGEQQ